MVSPNSYRMHHRDCTQYKSLKVSFERERVFQRLPSQNSHLVGYERYFSPMCRYELVLACLSNVFSSTDANSERMRIGDIPKVKQFTLSKLCSIKLSNRLVKKCQKNGRTNQVNGCDATGSPVELVSLIRRRTTDSRISGCQCSCKKYFCLSYSARRQYQKNFRSSMRLLLREHSSLRDLACGIYSLRKSFFVLKNNCSLVITYLLRRYFRYSRLRKYS